MTGNHQPTPTVARHALGEGMRRLREEKGLGRAEAAALINYSRDTIRRIELGVQVTKPTVVRDLCRIYGASSEEITRYCDYAIKGAERGLTEEHPGGAPPEFRAFADLEIRAACIQSVESEYIPGLLQTAEYLSAAQAAQLPLPDGRAAAIQALRRRRQDITFGRDDMPTIEIVIGKSAIDYLDELSADVRAGQLKRLREAATMPTVDIRVVTGLHAAMDGRFTILTPGESASGVGKFVYLESQDVGRYVESRDVVSLYERTFGAVRAQAIPLEEHLDGHQ